MNKNNLVFLNHVLESISKIEKFSKGLTRKKLLKDELRQSAIIRQVEIIGEAVKNLPIDFTVKYPQVEWSKIAGTKDKLIHNYFGIDLNVLWKILENDIPVLKEQMKKIKEELKSQ